MRTMTPPTPSPPPQESPLQLLVSQTGFWVSLIGLIFCLAIMSAVFTDPPEPPPVLGTVPEFNLTDQSNQPYGSDDLLGKVWVANFIFTRCETVCPLFSAEMAKLQKRTDNASVGIQLVSFSVDPEHDTPAVLKEYARRYSANPWYWHFLTGPIRDIRETVTDGLKTAMGESSSAATIQETLFHGSHFVLIDRQMQIRGFYRVEETDTVHRLIADIKQLINER